MVRRIPSGVSSAYSSSPLSTRSRASNSLGRMRPAELPMAVIFSFMEHSPVRYNQSYTPVICPCLSGLDGRQKLFADIPTLVVGLARHEIQPAAVAPLRP